MRLTGRCVGVSLKCAQTDFDGACALHRESLQRKSVRRPAAGQKAVVHCDLPLGAGSLSGGMQRVLALFGCDKPHKMTV